METDRQAVSALSLSRLFSLVVELLGRDLEQICLEEKIMLKCICTHL